MKITNIPNTVYEYALKLEKFESWGIDRAKEAYEYQSQKRGYTDLGLEHAISAYLLRIGPFAEGREFASSDGYSA